jgi:hypothetical protein
LLHKDCLGCLHTHKALAISLGEAVQGQGRQHTTGYQKINYCTAYSHLDVGHDHFPFLHEPIGSAHFAFVVIIAALECGSPRRAICRPPIIEVHSGTAEWTLPSYPG